MSEALYRKYRPQVFEDVVGQDQIERTIKNAIVQDKVSHAYLFCGPRGTGKTTTARLLAKALLCEKAPTAEPDGTCEDCRMIAAGEHPDVYELDAASRTGVENVREEIIGRVQFAPTRGRYKVYIIDEVHMLSTAAFNALLKTLEEPPDHVVFILCTTDPQKVPETIHSRCQRFDFRRISNEAIVSRLGAICVAEGVEFEGDALELVAYRADGGMRNALTSLEQLIAFGEGKVTLEVAERLLGSVDVSDMGEIMRAVGTRDVAACFTWTAEFVETGADLAQFTRDMAEHVRNMYVLSLAGAEVALEVSDAVRRELASELPLFGPDRLARMLGVLGDLSAELKTSTNPRLSFEIALTRMVRPDSDLTLESLAERIEALESGYSAVAHVVSEPRTAPAAAAAQADAPSMPAVAEPLRAQAQAPVQAEPREAAPAFAASPAAVASPAQEPGAARGGQAPMPAQDAPQAPFGGTQQAAPNQPSAAAAAPSGAASLFQNPAALQRMWQAALGSIRREKAAYGVLFMSTRTSFDARTGEVVIQFPAESSFAYTAVQKPDVYAVVKASIAQAAGGDVPFRFEQAGDALPFDGGAAASSGVAHAEPAPALQPAAQRAVAGSDPTPVPAAGAPASEAQPVSHPQASGAPGAGAPVRSEAPWQAVAARHAAGVAVGAAAAQAEPSFAAPEPDLPPLDVYGEVPAAPDDELPPWEEPCPAPREERPPWEMPTPQGQASASAPSASPGLPPEPDAVSSATPVVNGPDRGIEDMNANLAAGFGDGVSFEEVV